LSDAIDRRRFLARGLKAAVGVAVVGSAPGLLAACGGSSKGGRATASGAGVSSAVPKRGGRIVFAVESEVDGFDPTKNRWDPGGNMYGRTVYDPLAAVAADGSTKPYLAQSVTPNEDYTRWTITLRPNVTFHNGAPLDANAVKVNLEAQRASPLVGPAFTNVARVDATGPLTVVVAMKSPWVPFPAQLNGQYQAGYIVEPNTLLAGKAQSSPVGTGPFVFQQWVPGSHFTATRNPNYWRSGMPYLDSIEYRPIIDPQSRENSLKSGTVDIMHSSDLQNYAALHGNSSFVTISDLSSSIEPDMTFCMINTAVSPVDELRVRQALAYATDRQRYINIIDNGIPPPSAGPYVAGSPYDAPTGYPSFNLTKAQSLVKQYESEKGRPLSFQLAVLNTPKELERGKLLQAMWQKAGMQVQITQSEQSQYILNLLEGKYQVAEARQFAASDPDINYTWWSTSTVAPIGSFALNITRNNDPQIQRALDTGRTSNDPSARAAAYQEVARRLAQDIPYLWLDRGVWIVSARSSVQNFAGGTLPDGTRAVPLIFGEIWPTQIWLRE
jgi:ABC-type transport system substrate-binding protein